jgi:hypothetical protein
LECHTPIDQESRIWGDRLIKNYATALIKRQWAMNLSKFAEVILAGGTKLNAGELYNQAQAEIDKIELDSIYQYSEPPEPTIG